MSREGGFSGKLKQFTKPGKARFVLVYGVLLFGLLSATMATLLQRYVTGSQIPAGVNFIVFPVGGIFWGLFMWRYLRKAHERAQRRSSSR